MAVYLRLALSGMRKNGRLYLPYLCACIGMVAMFYIIAFLPNSDFMDGWAGNKTLKIILTLGIWVVMLFAAIFFFYTNSFLLKRRKREFGLYHVLGMGKGGIGRVLCWETLLCALTSLAGGLALGILLSKLAELALCRIITTAPSYRFSVSGKAVSMTLTLFGLIFLLILLNGLRQVRFSGTMELLRSESQGEKPPKANWLLGVGGLLLLGVAYWMAVTIQDPLSAMNWFFVAVLMVIVATYLIFLSGSVLFCRILQKNRNYYYKKQHFVSVSSMAYRMKRNGAGLASICILGTMVLVMIAGSACLYYGAENSLHARYPRSINATVAVEDTHYDFSPLREEFQRASAGQETSQLLDYRYTSLAGVLRDGFFEPDVRQFSSTDVMLYADLVYLYLLDGSDSTLYGGEAYAPGPGEALIYTVRTKYRQDTISFGSTTYWVAGTLSSLAVVGSANADIVPSIFLVVPDFEAAVEALGEVKNNLGEPMALINWYYGYDIDAPLETQQGIIGELYQAANREFDGGEMRSSYRFECLEWERQDYYSLYGGTYFLGLMLSVVFLCAAVLIIYYKQVSEGYEDVGRFEILQKVGMTRREIRQSINSQMLTVFLLPLAFSVLHLAFAFPMIRLMLLLFGINNLPLLLGTAGVSVLVFALFYTLVYRLTTGAYYRIVSE